MYIHATFTGIKAQINAQTKEPFGPGFEVALANQVAKLEIEGTLLQDPGEDFCIFRAFNENGEEIASKKVNGF